MATYMTIPEITENEPLLSVQAEFGGRTFVVLIAADDVAVRLMSAAHNGEQLPLVVLVTDNGMFALDNVYVTNVSHRQTNDMPLTELTFEAQDARLV